MLVTSYNITKWNIIADDNEFRKLERKECSNDNRFCNL